MTVKINFKNGKEEKVACNDLFEFSGSLILKVEEGKSLWYELNFIENYDMEG